MTAENVDIARRAYAAFNRGGVDAVLEYVDPQIEWRMSELFTREPRTFHGHEGVREVISIFEENLDELRVEPSEFIDAGDRVVVPVTLRGRAKGTGEETAFDVVHTWTASRGRAIRLDVYSSKDEALGAGAEPPA